MQKITILLFCLLNIFSQLLCAETVVDVYGTNPAKGKMLLSQYGKQIEGIENSLMEESKKRSNHQKISTKVAQLLQDKERLMDKIKKDFGFYFFDMNTVFYPDLNKYFTTLEVIEANDKKRQSFVNAGSKRDIPVSSHDLIDKMMEYEQLDTQLVLTNKLTPKPIQCPVFHCINGFEHPQLKPYLQLFNHGVKAQKDLVIHTLQKDKNAQRRAAAVFLVGHFQDAQEILSLITPHITDSDLTVRNNAMRVIGATLEKSKLKLKNIMPFIVLLDSPYVEERNKALFVLLQASHSQHHQAVIRQKAAKQLLTLAQLKQPNNADFAYLILKQISGKHFAKQNIKAWENWLNKA